MKVFSTNDSEKYKELLIDLKLCKIYLAEEGELIKVYNKKNRWKCFSKKFQMISVFINTLNIILKTKLPVADESHMFDRFCATLDPQYYYTFLLSYGTIYFDGYFLNTEKEYLNIRMDGNPTCIQTPQRLYINKLCELENYVNNINPVVIHLSNKQLIKLKTPEIVESTYLCLKNKGTIEEIKYFCNTFPKSVTKYNRFIAFLLELYKNRFIYQYKILMHPCEYKFLKKINIEIDNGNNGNSIVSETDIEKYLYLNQTIFEKMYKDFC